MRMKAFVLVALLLLVARGVCSDYVVRGTVYGDDGSARPFAYVSVSGRTFITQADRYGRYSLTLPEGSYTLAADMSGYRQDKRQLSLTCDAYLDFVLYEDLINLSVVTVTGTLTPHELKETPVVTRIITEDDIKKLDATNIQDILSQELPGLEFTFQMNQQVSLNIQGLGGMAILILVDGERLAGETLDNTDFQRLTADDIERVEIIKGAASALYGSNSVGAVVNIITKKSPEGWHTNLGTHWGMHGEQRYGGSVGLGYGKLNSMTNVQYDSKDTYVIHDRDGDGATTIYGTGQWNIKEKLCYQVNQKNSLTARACYYFHERDYTADLDDHARDFSGSLCWESLLSAGGKLDITYNFDRYDKSNYYTQLRVDVLRYKNVQNNVRVLYTQNLGSGFTLLGGGDVMSDRLMSYQFEDDGSHSQVTADLFAQAEWASGKHWYLVAGLRGDWLTGKSLNVSPKVAAMYTLGPLNMRASYSRGFRAPTLKNKYMNYDMSGIFMIYGNTDLKSEHSHSFSLSGEYSYRRYCLTATGYFNIMRNEITTLWDSNLSSPLSDGSMVYQNVKGRNLAGVDISFSARYRCGIGANLSYAYFHEFPAQGELNLCDSRPHSMTMKLDYRRTFKNYEFDLIFSGRVMGKADYFTYSTDYSKWDTPAHSPRYSVWKLCLSQRIAGAYSLLLTIDNIANYRNRVFSYNSLVTTGREFSATVSIDIDKVVSHNGRKK